MSQADPAGALMPLTLPQLDFWEEFCFHPEEPIATVAHCLDIEGVASETALIAAIERTIAESDVLSVRFHAGPGRNRPWQSCDPRRLPALRRFDLRASAKPLQEARARMEADVAAPLDLRGDPISAQWLLRLGEARYLWYIRAHHIVLDGYGIALMEQRCGQLYAHYLGLGDAGPAFHRFADFVAEEEAYCESRRHETDRAFWRDYLASSAALPVLHRGDRDVSGPPHEALGALPAEFTRNLPALSERIGVGWPDLLVLLSGLYLFRCLPTQRSEGRETLPLWLPFMSRWGSIAAHMPAMLVNILPFQLSVTLGETLADVLRRSAAELRRQRRHGRFRIEQIAIDGGMPEGSRYFFSPLINVLPFSTPAFHSCAVTRHVLTNGQGEGLDLTFRSQDDGSGLTLAITADSTMFAAEWFDRHSRALPAFLAAAVAPDALLRPVGAIPDGVYENDGVLIPA